MIPRTPYPRPWATGFIILAMVISPAALRAWQENPPQTPSPPHRELTPEQRADVYMARKNYADAADYYYRALKKSSFKDAGLWNKLGIAFQEEEKFGRAIRSYKMATQLNPGFAEAWNNIGTVYATVKKYPKSLRYYRQAIQLKGDAAGFRLNLGTSYYHLKKFDLAVAEYRTALSLNPQVVNQESATGTTIHAGGEDPEFYFYMAKAYASIGDAGNAVRYLRRAMEEGFDASKRLEGDPDFAKISQDPAYIELRRNPPVAIKN